MADKTATFSLSLSYPNPGGAVAAAPTQVVSVPYQAMTYGELDIPDATAASTELPISLAGIGTAATGIALKNESGQELDVEFNDGTEKPFSIPTGGMVIIAFPTEPSATPITALTVTTSAEQSGDGIVKYWAFGDPTGV